MTITLAAAMRDPLLLGAPFQAPSFWTWHTVAKVISGEQLDEREAALFCECTGRTELPKGPVSNVTLLGGRRTGKDRFMSATAIYRAALAAKWQEILSPGEVGVVILLGADRKQARILRRYCQGLLEAPMIKALVSRSTDELIEFKSGVSVEIITNDAALVRGRSAIAVLGTEVCYWQTDAASSSSDEEVVFAAEPSMGMVPDGGLMIMASSVYRKRGYMYRKFKELHGDNQSEEICWLAPSRVMNPLLPEKIVTKAMASDPQRAKAEFLSQWREDISDFIPLDILERATDFGVRERSPMRGVKYFAFTDAAGGTGKDAFSICIAHREKDGTVVIDFLRERRPRFVPAEVVAEYAAILRLYNVTQITGDRYSSGWNADEWSRAGFRYLPSERTKSEVYLASLPMLLSGQVRLIDNEAMRQQFVGLERRVHSNGRESVDDSGAASANDDLSNVCAGAMVLAAQPEYQPVMPVFGTYGRCEASNHLGQVGGFSNAEAYGNNAGPQSAHYSDAPSEFWRMVGNIAEGQSK
jgi:hypothetical protein